MSKHKREHRWVIVKNGAALMTYEYMAFFFTDNFDDDDKPVYYNQITDSSIDIWSLAYRSKRTAEIVLKELSSIEKKSHEENPQYTPEEIDNWGTKYPDDPSKFFMPSFGEDFDGAYVAKVYNYPYAQPYITSKNKRKQIKLERLNRRRAYEKKKEQKNG